MTRKRLALCFFVGIVWLRPAAAQDSAPIGAISYFDGACPVGWRLYERSAGRAIVPVGDMGLGRSVGTPLEEGSRAIVVYADGLLNSASNRAEPGQPLVFFATGEGQTSPPGATGSPAWAPYPAPLADVELWIGGERAILDYAGAAPSFVGLMQINARMTMATGKAAVVLKIGGSTSAAEVSVFGR